MFHSAGTLETEFKKLGKKLDHFVSNAEDAAAAVEGEALHGIAEIQAKRHALRLKLDELRDSGDGKWEVLKDGIEAAWKDLVASFEKLSN